VKYEQGFYIPEDDIPHIHRRGNLKCVAEYFGHQLSAKLLMAAAV
jgi:hypothetical protein